MLAVNKQHGQTGMGRAIPTRGEGRLMHSQQHCAAYCTHRLESAFRRLPGVFGDELARSRAVELANHGVADRARRRTARAEFEDI